MTTRDYIVILVCLAVAGIVNSQMDVIKFQPSNAWFDSNWWLALDGYAWDHRSWWTKNVFSFCSDGWHFLKMVQLLSFTFAINYLISINRNSGWYCKIIGAVISYTIIGIFFEVGYNLL